MVETQNKQKRFFWWHAVIIFIVANAISFIPAGYGGNEVFYNSFRLPELAPPEWMFPPVWFFNNVTSLFALYWVANMPQKTSYRKTIIILEAICWVLFSIFTIVYFGMKSPVLGSIDTVIACILTTISLILTFKISKKSGWALMPRFLWLLLASYVSVYVFLYNKDVFFNIGPFIK